MAASVPFLEELTSHAETTLTQTAEREAALAELLARTREHWEAWHGQWQEILTHLEARRRDLANHDTRATAIVSVAEEALAQTEAGLRAWLDAARELAEACGGTGATFRLTGQSRKLRISPAHLTRRSIRSHEESFRFRPVVEGLELRVMPAPVHAPALTKEDHGLLITPNDDGKMEHKVPDKSDKAARRAARILADPEKYLRRQRPPKGGGGFSVLSNQPPTVNPGPTLYGCECQQVLLSGWVADSDGPGPYTVVINWGDGITEQFTLPFPFSPSSFSRPHTYADDGDYVITVTADDGGGGTGGATTTAQIAGVKKVEWVATANSPLDTNPNPGAGKRIFPDKLTHNENPQLAASRQRVKVRVELTKQVSGVDVYITIFDVDDPSSNAAPVDQERDFFGNEITDNRGPGPVSAIVASTAGVAEFEFTVSLKPGDNYRAVATCHAPALTTLRAKQDDGEQARIFDGAVPHNMTHRFVRFTEDLLTVWRRLHVEVDSMGSPPAGQQWGADDLLTGDVPDPDISSMAQAFMPAYVTVQTDTGQDSSNMPWLYNFEFIAGGPTFAELERYFLGVNGNDPQRGTRTWEADN